MSHDRSDLFATAAMMNVVNSSKLATQKKRHSGDLFKSAWSFGDVAEASPVPHDASDSVFTPKLLKYSPDQPRDDDGRWVDGGGGSSGTDARINVLNVAAYGVKPDDPASAERFLEVSRQFVADVKQGEIAPTQSQWKDSLSPIGKVLERLAESVEVLAVPAGVGVAVGTLAGASMGSKLIGFRVGAALAGVLAVAMIYDAWANDRQAYRSREEARRVRDNIQDLERALRQLKDSQED